MRRPALIIGCALLGLVGLWFAVLLPPTHRVGPRDTLSVAAAPSPVPTAASNPAGLGTPTAASHPIVAGDPKAGRAPSKGRTATPTARPSAPSTVGGPHMLAGPAPHVPATGSASGARTASPLPPTASPDAYTFAPTANGTGPAPTAEMRFSDLTLHAGQQVLVGFTMNTAGAIEFDAHTASSSSTAGAYPTSALLACVEFLGQAPCRPVVTPQPGFWAVTTADIARHTQYHLRVLATANSTLLAGIHIGWRGPTSLSVTGFRLPGGCQATVAKGYTPGCGLKYKIVIKGPVAFTATTPTSGLQISLKNTVSNAKAYSGPLSSPQHIQVPSAGEWSGHLYPSDGRPVDNLTLTMDWH